MAFSKVKSQEVTSLVADNDTDYCLKQETSQDEAETETKHSAVKTPWRIQEARNIFALMREEYEASKKLSVPKRYHELKRIIEMFTDEPITQRLLYLSTAEAELRYSRALQFSQSPSFSSTNSDSSGRMSLTSSVSSNLSTSRSTSCSRTSSCSGTSLSTSCSRTSSCSGTSLSTSCSRTSSRSGRFKSSDSLSSNQKSNSSRKDDILCSMDSKPSANSLWWRRKQSENKRSLSRSFRENNNSDSFGVREGSFKTRAESLPSGAHGNQRFQFVPSIIIDGPWSNDDRTVGKDPASELARSAEAVDQACSKAYNFFVNKIIPKGTWSPVFDFISYYKDTHQQNSVLDGQHLPATTPGIDSLESFFHPSHKGHRVTQRSNVRSTSKNNSRSFHHPDMTSASTCSTPSFCLRRNYFSRKSSFPSQNHSGTPRDRVASGFQINTRQASDGLNRSSYFNFDSQDNQKQFSTVGVTDSISIDGEFLSPNSRVSYKTKEGVPKKQDSINGRCVFSEEFFFKTRKEFVPATRLPEQKTEDIEAVMNNIVLMIAHDHITKLRNEYENLDSTNVWMRYRKMKKMIKSCMNVLKSG